MLSDKTIVKIFPFSAKILRGVGQIMLQKNAYTGLLFVIGIFFGSPVMGAGVLLATISGTMTAKILKYDNQEISQGLYGFSAALVGVALTLFYKPVLAVWIAIVTGSAAATVLQHFFIIKKIPLFTLPFVLVTWLAFFIFNTIYPLEPSLLLSSKEPIINLYFFPFHGFGQVIFQSKLIVGIIFLLAVFIHSPLAALFGIAGAVTAGLFSAFLPVSVDVVALGLWSYNAVLSAIVFTGRKLSDIIWMIISSLLSVLIYFIMIQLNFIPLTFPFVAATVITLIIRKLPQSISERELMF